MHDHTHAHKHTRVSRPCAHSQLLPKPASSQCLRSPTPHLDRSSNTVTGCSCKAPAEKSRCIKSPSKTLNVSRFYFFQYYLFSNWFMHAKEKTQETQVRQWLPLLCLHFENYCNQAQEMQHTLSMRPENYPALKPCFCRCGILCRMNTLRVFPVSWAEARSVVVPSSRRYVRIL